MINAFKHHIEYDENARYDWYIRYVGYISKEEYALQYLSNLTEELVNGTIERTIPLLYNIKETVIIKSVRRSEQTKDIFNAIEEMCLDLVHESTKDKKMIMFLLNGTEYEVIIV